MPPGVHLPLSSGLSTIYQEINKASVTTPKSGNLSFFELPSNTEPRNAAERSIGLQSKGDLQSHKTSTICQYDRCSQLFKQKRYFDSHRKQHSGILNCQCRICSSKFTIKDALDTNYTSYTSYFGKKVHMSHLLVLHTFQVQQCAQ